ncbi:bifunctional lysylphosphatidylglycerol flippase/synthetase MprF [Corynebacterium silvaticum]|uniref:Phosphatidylglycerol lysyltransferase domain-containing protein n=1 Tax=Corynebacterium silvaticum TaxID=2320431 RepID=A0A7Y4PAE0_9CORY|nr:phosphatidylglycerol lysyltransferase domain-containing protein [Corynebacterium silvaticum]ARU46100.1 phosphatidylglycerol lysyltransferase domain-containing protein [Corynebacterium silvaticum]NON71152.1 DUF2156 domain-containing protein [Corynebacterium silvaticum]UWH01209.1 DUF2156 domain-containing protein [Corynebacterium silvaticum]UWH03256.1 DUF2156 domain-containing protein [Corynebacterium silvaticum]UWH05292.1 DUF2156 domain-containing protein [Corynebacterium silvaticum]
MPSITGITTERTNEDTKEAGEVNAELSTTSAKLSTRIVRNYLTTTRVAWLPITSIRRILFPIVSSGKSIITRVPISFLLLALLWILYASIDHPRDVLGLNSSEKLPSWHLLTAGLTVGSHQSAVLATLGVLFLAVPAEIVLGSIRFLVAAGVMNGISIPLGVLSARFIETLGLNQWGNDLLNETLLSPTGWIFGTAAVASSSMSTLWRRRLRLMLFSLSFTLVLFSGTLTDSVATVATVVGTIVGAVQLGGRKYHKIKVAFRRPSLRESRILVAVLCMSVALGPVVVAFNPHANGPFSAVTSLMWQPQISSADAAEICSPDYSSPECIDALTLVRQTGFAAIFANLVPVIAQLIFCIGLIRGRRVAWGLSLVLQCLSILAIAVQLMAITDERGNSIIFTVNFFEVMLPWLITLLALGVSRRLFFVSVERKDVVRNVSLILATFVITALIWVIGVYYLADSFSSLDSLLYAFYELPSRYLPPALALVLEHVLYPESQLAWILYQWVGAVFWMVALFALYRLIMSIPATGHGASDISTARKILRKGSGDHLSWMSMWDGNSFWFAEPQTQDDVAVAEDASATEQLPRGFVAFRLVKGVAVTLGEPVVLEQKDRLAVAREFKAYASGRGWRVAWYSTREEFAEEIRVDGFRKLHVAEESVLQTTNTEFKGKKFQNIRTARNRAGKEGISTVWTSWSEASPELQNRIVVLSEEWVSEKALPEMGFTLGTLEELKDSETKLLVAVDENGHVHGVTSWLPVRENGVLAGYTLDFMRRDANGFRPVIEFLLAEALIKAKELGCSWISLSGAPLAPPSGQTMPTLLDATLNKAGEAIEPLYGFRSLAASKYKFHPEHQAWYLCYDDELALPTIGLAVSQCYLPQLSAKDARAALTTWMRAQRMP